MSATDETKMPSAWFLSTAVEVDRSATQNNAHLSHMTIRSEIAVKTTSAKDVSASTSASKP